MTKAADRIPRKSDKGDQRGFAAIGSCSMTGTTKFKCKICGKEIEISGLSPMSLISHANVCWEKPE